MIEVDLDRAELGDLLTRAQEEHEKQREKAMSPDGQEVNAADGSDPEAAKSVEFDYQLNDTAVAGGIVNAINTYLNEQK